MSGVPFVVESADEHVAAHVARTYSAYVVDSHPAQVPVVRAGPSGDPDRALIETLNAITDIVVDGLAKSGALLVHAAAVASDRGALVLMGPSGSGKTTLALGLVARGFRLLSDEIAVVPAQGEAVLPYRRSVHVRAGTPALVPELAFLSERPQVKLGDGNKWSLTPDELEAAIPGCLGETAPLRHLLLLEPRLRAGEDPALLPVSPAVAAVELIGATPAAAVNFSFVMRRLGRWVEGARCARLYAGSLEPTLEVLHEWLDGD